MGSFLVIGMGRFGSSVAIELCRLKHEVLAVDEFEENIAGIMHQVTDVVVGDAKDEAVLRSLDVKSFDGVIVSIAGAIEDSILITMMLKEMNAKSIVCKAQNERHARILTQLGADRVVRPEYDMGIRVARSLTQHNMVDFLEISPDYGIMEVVTPKHWVEKSIVKNNLRRKYGVTVIAIRCAKTDKVKFLPNADVILNDGDILTLIGSIHELDTIGVLK